MIYGYARVSTLKQGKDGNSLPDQERALRAAGCTEVYHDTYTGTKMDRPQFSALLGKLEAGDTLVVTKLDRFARTAMDGVSTIRDLVGRGVNVHILNMGRVDNTPMGKLMVTVMLAFAEYERDMIYERTQTGRAIAKASGKRVDGRPEKAPEEFPLLFAAWRAGETTVATACKRMGICRATWYKLAKGMPEAA